MVVILSVGTRGVGNRQDSFGDHKTREISTSGTPHWTRAACCGPDKASEADFLALGR